MLDASPRRQRVDARAAACRGRCRTVTVRSSVTMSPPAKIPGRPVIMSASTAIDAARRPPARRPRRAARGRPPGRGPARRASASSSSSLPGRLREAVGVELHPLEHAGVPSSHAADRRQPAAATPSSRPPRLLDRGRASARGCGGRRRSPPRRPAAGRSAPRRSPCCRRRRPRRGGPSSGGSPSSMLCSSDTASRTRAASPAGMSARRPTLRADGQEGGVEPAVRRAPASSVARPSRPSSRRPRPVAGSAAISASSDVAGQPVRRDAVAHHAAGRRPGLADRDRVTAPEPGGRRPTGRPARRRPRAPACRSGRRARPAVQPSRGSPRRRGTARRR